MRTTWEAKSMRGIRTLRPDQSVIADTLALKTSSWFRQTLRVGSQQVVLFQCQACGTFDCQLTWVNPPVSSRTTRKDSNTLPSNDEAHTRPLGSSHTPSDGLAHTSPQGDPQGAFRRLRRRGTSRTAARQSFEPSRGRAYFSLPWDLEQAGE